MKKQFYFVCAGEEIKNKKKEKSYRKIVEKLNNLHTHPLYLTKVILQKFYF